MYQFSSTAQKSHTHTHTHTPYRNLPQKTRIAYLFGYLLHLLERVKPADKWVGDSLEFFPHQEPAHVQQHGEAIALYFAGKAQPGLGMKSGHFNHLVEEFCIGAGNDSQLASLPSRIAIWQRNERESVVLLTC